MKKTRIFSLLLTTICIASQAQAPLAEGFDHPQDTARTKVWWFFGETETTREGITADLEAFKTAGVGGVVYYDQVHGSGEGADKVFDEHWWQSLIFASQEARRLGLSFEANIGNGYVAGGKWITPDRSMQRLTVSETLLSGGKHHQLALPDCPRGWHHDVAVLALPYREELLGTSRLLSIVPTGQRDSALVFDFDKPFTARSISYMAKAQGKARTSSMQVPPFAPQTEMTKGETTMWNFFGCGYRELPNIGLLEVSDDGTHYRPVCELRPRYQNLGGVKQQTIAFPTTRGRYFRITMTNRTVTLDNVVISARACVDGWEAKASLVSDYIDSETTPYYNIEEMVQATDIVDLTDRMAPDGTLAMPEDMKGDWLVMRFVAVTTGGHTKHGRKEALGLECDKLSVEGARLHWQSYTKPVIDSIRAHGGALEGICMDSHEAGPQNWTQDMPQQFRRLRGYDLKPFLPTIAGGMIVSVEDNHSSLLKDFRRTISDLMTTNYFGEFNRLCREEGLTLTAQAVGGALCMAGDNIEVKRLVDKPQGEFWGYQTEGNYDIKDCSSAAHVYGKQIASGEAFTDITYKHSLADIKNLADAAYAFGINEFVVCAVAYQADAAGRRLNTANGRQYVLNRLNTLWPLSRPFWDYQARCSWMLRQGRPVSDFALYLGDDVPKRILAHLLPPIPQGYDYDALTTDALLYRVRAVDGRLVLPDGVSYSMLLLPYDETLTPAVRQRVEALRAAGVKVWDPHDGQPLGTALSSAELRPDVDVPAARRLYFCHRRTSEADVYFLNNHSDDAVDDRFTFRLEASNVELWNPVTGECHCLASESRNGLTSVHLRMAPRQSFFVVLTNSPSGAPLLKQSAAATSLPLSRPWQLTFNPTMGGPARPVVLDSLTDWSLSSDSLQRYYSGTAVYTTTFTLPAKDRSAVYRLAFGQVGSAAQVVVNGHEAATVWCSPWTADITPYVKKGVNKLEIRVANCLWNRLVGDARRNESERLMQQTTPLASPSDSLVSSGLIGRVTINVERQR
ncbi:MAG: glycosyl hydrolase family 2 [Prevotella sp.]|nr:glycosyl hydrolase family 2 [Prevotella sp.]